MLLTFVVVGGGFAGVETVAGINDFVREVLPSYSHLREGMLRVVLVHAGAVVLPGLGDILGAYAQKKLAQRGVEIRLNTRVSGVTARTLELSDGTAIESSAVVWAAGTAPNPLLKELPCAKERGRLVVNRFLEVVGWPGVWALRDCAAVPDASTGKTSPPTAQHALREGRVLARMRALAMHLLEQIAEIGKETACGNELELGPAVLEGYCGVSYGLRNHCVSKYA